jgi:hypothetical protein
MDISELITVHISPLLIVLIAGLFLRKVWPLRKEATFGFLCTFLISAMVLYGFAFSFRFPTPEKNLVAYTGGVIPFIVFFCHGCISISGALFSLYLIGPRYKKSVIYILLVIFASYVVLLSVFPPEYVEVREGVEEWILVGTSGSFFYVIIIMAFVPVALFLFNFIQSKKGIDRLTAFLLFLSFLMYSSLGLISDPFGLFPPLGIRRTLMAISIYLLYLGFMVPPWLRETFEKKGEDKVPGT